MKITMVKKQFADGSLCKKCIEVSEKLKESDYLSLIDETLIADENNPDSPGMLLAKQYDVSRAPFFIVDRDGSEPEIYTVYFKLVKDVLDKHQGQ